MTQKIHVLNVRLPNDVITWLDSLVKQGIYNSRSEAIRGFIREHLREVEQ
ncbi:ribbon-helix-helix domain-containing protein [Candidatus Woesearchaeota archaeon]|nr:ribbon-helix-helix domain-containing protein [Candidatus Woesearchaeota archaeon]